ncbi:RNA-binding domain-containing protein [Hypoxylon sp. EC38]|nr:RNA-binding domain-containing protein [Hypoxylon sp. EC38]
MDYRSPSRDRYQSRSPTPKSRYSRSPTPVRRRRSFTRSPSPVARRNGRLRSESRSLSRDRDERGRSESPLRGSTKIVVEKLTKTINEDHLREIFGQYGPIRDLDMPMNRQFNTNRGTAYILYIHEADAEAAIAHMHEAVLDGTVINVSIVLPRRKFSPSPPTASRGANIDPRLPAPGPRGGVEGELGSAEEERRARPRDMDGQAVITSTLTALALTQGLDPLPVATVALRDRTRPDPGLPRDDGVEEETVTMIMTMIDDAALAMIASEVVVARVVAVEDIAKLGYLSR